MADQWEYAIVRAIPPMGAYESFGPDGVDTSKGTAVQVLNDLGREGFELVGTSGGEDSTTEFYLKRPTPASNPARATLDRFGG